MGWIIAGAVVAFILILLMTSVKVRFEYDGDLRLKINWYFITILKIPAQKKKQKRRNKKVEKAADDAVKQEAKAAEKSAQEDKSDEKGTTAEKKKSAGTGPEKARKTPAKASEKLTLKDIWEIVKYVWDSLDTPLRRLLRATRISGFRLDIVCGGDDAAKAALNYGRTSAVAGAAAAFLEGCFTMRSPQYNITADFMSEETTTRCEFTARLTVIAALAFLFWALGRAVRNYLNRKEAAAALGKLKK